MEQENEYKKWGFDTEKGFFYGAKRHDKLTETLVGKGGQEEFFVGELNLGIVGFCFVSLLQRGRLGFGRGVEIVGKKIVEKYQEFFMIWNYFIEVLDFITLVFINGFFASLRFQNHVDNLPVLSDKIWLVNVVYAKRKRGQVVAQALQFLPKHFWLALNLLLSLIILGLRFWDFWRDFPEAAEFKYWKNDVTAGGSDKILGMVKESDCLMQ